MMGEAVVAPTGAIPINPCSNEMPAIIVYDTEQSIVYWTSFTSDFKHF